MKRYGYTYLTTFTRPTDGHIFYYVGQKLGSKVNRKYHGSGLRINNLVRKYGRKGNARCTVLAWAYDQEELNFYERSFITTAKQVYGRDCVNLVYGGANGKPSLVTRRRMSAAKVGSVRSPETIAKHRAKILGRTQSAEHVAKRMKAHIGTKRSEETKQRLSEAWKTRAPDSAETRLRKSQSHLGVKMSAESSAKKSASLMGRVHEQVSCPHCAKTGAKPGLVRWHFDNCRRAS